MPPREEEQQRGNNPTGGTVELHNLYNLGLRQEDYEYLRDRLGLDGHARGSVVTLPAGVTVEWDPGRTFSAPPMTTYVEQCAIKASTIDDARAMAAKAVRLVKSYGEGPYDELIAKAVIKVIADLTPEQLYSLAMSIHGFDKAVRGMVQNYLINLACPDPDADENPEQEAEKIEGQLGALGEQKPETPLQRYLRAQSAAQNALDEYKTSIGEQDHVNDAARRWANARIATPEDMRRAAYLTPRQVTHFDPAAEAAARGIAYFHEAVELTAEQQAIADRFLGMDDDFDDTDPFAGM